MAYDCDNIACLLGEEGLEGFEEATHRQSVSQFDTAVHSSAGQAEQLANRVAQLFHTINYLPVLLKRAENMERVKQQAAQTQRKELWKGFNKSIMLRVCWCVCVCVCGV